MTEAMQDTVPPATGTDSKGPIAYPAAALVAMGIGTLSLGIVFYASEVHHASPAHVGFLAATWSFHYILGCILLRPLVDTIRPRHSIVGAAAVMGLAVLLVLASSHLVTVYVCYAVYGLATAFFWPPLMGWLATGSEGARLNRSMGRFNLSWSCGSIIGPILAGILARYNPRYPVAAAGVLYLGAALYAAWAGRRLTGAENGLTRRPACGVEVSEPSLGTPLRYPAWIGLFAAYVVLGLVFNVFPIAAQQQMGMSKPVVGVLLFVRALCTTLALGALGRTTVWHYRGSQMAAGLAAFALVLAALSAVTSAIIVGVLLALVGALVAQCYANSLFHGVAGSGRRAARMAIHEALLSAGLVCGGAYGGVLFQSAGYAAVCWTAAGVLALAAVAATAFTFSRRARSAKPFAAG